jgi:Trypsin-like peptidase domain
MPGVQQPEWLTKAREAFVTVGGGEAKGRGFIVETERQRLVITAAHCLPHLPAAHRTSFTEERTYANLLAPLGKEPTVYADCLFVDPVADIAVLCEPDYRQLRDEADAYAELVDSGQPLQVGAAKEIFFAWLLTLAGQWERCAVSRGPRWLTIHGAAQNGTASGTSGSPIVDDHGRAVGMVAIGSGFGEPSLASNLPVWLLKELELEDVDG